MQKDSLKAFLSHKGKKPNTKFPTALPNLA